MLLSSGCTEDLLSVTVSYPLLDFEDMTEFLEEVIEALTMDEEVRTFGEVMIPVFDILLGRIKDLDLCQILLYTYLDMLLYFTKQKDIAKVCVLALQRARNFCVLCRNPTGCNSIILAVFSECFSSIAQRQEVEVKSQFACDYRVVDGSYAKKHF